MLSRGCPVTSAILTTSKTDEKSEVLSEFFTRRLGNGKTVHLVLAVTFVERFLESNERQDETSDDEREQHDGVIGEIVVHSPAVCER